MSVVITAPTAGARVSGTIQVRASFDGTKFQVATLTVDGVQVASTSNPSIVFTLNTTTLTEGAHELGVHVRYGVGNSGTKVRWVHAICNVVVDNVPDSTFTVSSSIADGASLSVATAWIATASIPVSKVEFWVDGKLQWTETVTPYQFNGDPAGLLYLSAGAHQLKLVAYATLSGPVAEKVQTVSFATPPPPPPPDPSPSPSGTPITHLSDFVNNRWGSTMVNRWCDYTNGTSPAANAYQDLSRTQYPWAAPVSGPGSLEVSTPYGAGFLFKCAQFMSVTSGGKKSEVGDFDNFIVAGVDHVFAEKVMFPSAGNAQGFPGPNASWNLFWELHDTGDAFQWGINTEPSAGPVPCLYATSLLNGVRRIHYDTVALQLGHWYDLRVEFRLSAGSDGYARFYRDGALFYTIAGANMNTGQHPYMQLGGIYGQAQKYNEVYHAGMFIEG